MKNVKYAGDVLCFVFVVKKLYKHIHVISTHTLDHISHIARQSIYFSFLFFAFLSFGESARKISFIHMIIIIILLRPSHDLTRAHYVYLLRAFACAAAAGVWEIESLFKRQNFSIFM